MASPWQKYRFTSSWGDEQVEQLDEMLEDIYAFLSQSPLGTSDDLFDFSELFTSAGVLYTDASTFLPTPLTNVVSGRALLSQGVSSNPAWGQVDLTTTVTGILPVGNGGTGTSTAFTPGSVVFAGTSGVYTQDNSNFFWDNGNDRLGIITATPGYRLDVRSTSTASVVHFGDNSSDEGIYFSTFNAFDSSVIGSAAFNGSNWIAKKTTAELIAFDTGKIQFNVNTGTSAASSFTPTLLGSIYGASGTVAFGGSTAETFSDVSGTTIKPVLAGAGTISSSTATDRVIGMYSKFTASNTAPARSFRGYLIVSNSSGTMASANGFTGTIEITGSSNVTEASFVSGNIIVNNAGATLVTARGIDIGNATITAGAITNQAGIRINALSGATNNTHLLIGQSGVPTGTFGIYNASTADNYFAGEIGIGTTTPGGALDIGVTYSTDQAFVFRATGTHNTATAGTVYGAQFNTRMSHTTGTQNAIQTFFIQNYYRGTSASSPAVTSMAAVFARTAMDGASPTGTITNARVFEIDSIANQATGTPAVTFTNAVGVLIRNQGAGTGSNGLTVTNAMGLAIGDQTGPSGNLTNLLVGALSIPSGTWSIHNSATTNNYFAGPLYMGHTTTWGSGTNFISFADGTIPGTPAANTGAVYADDVNGDTNIFAMNEQSVTNQLTGLHIRKTADESVANNTLQDDNHIVGINLLASSGYEFEIVGFFTGAGTAGIQVQLDGTVGVSSLKYNVEIFDATGASVAFARTTAFNTPTGVDVTGNCYFVIRGCIETSTVGNIRLEWAQNTTDAGNSTTLQENSYAVFHKLNA